MIHLYGNNPENRYLSLFVPSSAIFIGKIPLVTCVLPPVHTSTKYALETLYSLAIPVHSGREVSNTETTDLERLRALIQSEKLNIHQQKSGSKLGFFIQGGLVGLCHILLGLSGLSILIVKIGHYFSA